MFAVEVRDHIMIAHSFPSPTFGPAQGVHGATFTVDCAFFAAEMDDESLVVDIGLATEALAETLLLARLGFVWSLWVAAAGTAGLYAAAQQLLVHQGRRREHAHAAGSEDFQQR